MAKFSSAVVEPIMLPTKLSPETYTFSYDDDPTLHYNRPALISALAGIQSRTSRIVRSIVRAVSCDRSIVVLSERLAHLRTMAEMCEQLGIETNNIGVALWKWPELEEVATRQLIFMTYQMAAELMDSPSIDTAFLATPVEDVEQPIRHILRDTMRKKSEMVIDYVDGLIVPCMEFFLSRKRQYEAMGYIVH